MTADEAPYALMGTMPDRVVAGLCALSVSTVARWRTRRHIAPYRQHVSTTRYMALLRQSPEGCTTPVVARALGVSRQAVWQIFTALERQGVVRKERGPRDRAGFMPCRWGLIVPSSGEGGGPEGTEGG